LFECILFESARERFYLDAGVPFDFEALKIDERSVSKCAARCGESIFKMAFALIEED
jgi:hypothetical protein